MFYIFLLDVMNENKEIKASIFISFQFLILLAGSERLHKEVKPQSFERVAPLVFYSDCEYHHLFGLELSLEFGSKFHFLSSYVHE